MPPCPLFSCPEVDNAVLTGSADVSVHSLKDAPPVTPPGLLLLACLPREDVRDAFILGKQSCSSLCEQSNAGCGAAGP